MQEKYGKGRRAEARKKAGQGKCPLARLKRLRLP
jgi:hypothetical protein